MDNLSSPKDDRNRDVVNGSLTQRRSPRSVGPQDQQGSRTPQHVEDFLNKQNKPRLSALGLGSKDSSASKRQSSSSGRKLAALTTQKRGPPSLSRLSSAKTAKRLLGTPQSHSKAEKDAAPELTLSLRTNMLPPRTVAEAHEFGELARLRDDILWTLEGLKSNSVSQKQNALATVVDVYSNRRKRAALYASNMVERILQAFGNMSVQEDLIVALGAATLIMLLSQPGTISTLARDDLAGLVARLLQYTSSVVPGRNEACDRILHVLQDVPIAKVLPREASFSPVGIILTALCNALDPHNGTDDTEEVKQELRRAGVLHGIAKTAVAQTQSLVEMSPTMDTVQALWRLERSLTVLEHACFACAENEAHLASIEIEQGCSPFVVRVNLAHWLVQQVRTLSRQVPLLGLKKECLRALLAVLMNVTQNNADGCEKVILASGLDVVSGALIQICLVDGTSSIKSADQLRGWVDELNACLGVLINLAEARGDARAHLLTKTSPNQGGMVPLLCQLINLTAEAAGETGSTAWLDAVPSSQAGEVTLDALHQGDREAAASVIEIYAAILLGFLIDGAPIAQREAATLLPGGTLEPVVMAVKKCLGFYLTAGALTQRTEASLRGLLNSLQTTT